MKKVRNLIIFFLVIFLFFIVVVFTPKNYNFDYQVNSFKVHESFDKKEKVYRFVLENENDTFEYSLAHKYVKNRGLINKIKKDDNCIIVNSDKLNDFSVCYEKGNYYTPYCSDELHETISKTYENIDIYDLKNRKFFIWNYTEFLSVDKKEIKKIDLFDADIYELDLITKLKKYLVVADYDQKYTFNKLYLINSKNDKVEEISLDKEIYFNSYILGTYKKHIYLYDLQQEKEYKINPYKGEVAKNALEIRVDNNWESISSNKLNKKTVSFEDSALFKYYIENEILYYQTANSKIKVTNKSVTNIVEANEQEAFFISGDTLYYVNIHKGISKIMRYSEWNFASKNIYIF